MSVQVVISFSGGERPSSSVGEKGGISCRWGDYCAVGVGGERHRHEGEACGRRGRGPRFPAVLFRKGISWLGRKGYRSLGAAEEGR